MDGLRNDLAGQVTLGFRTADASVVQKGGDATAPLYSPELGDATQVALRLGGTTYMANNPASDLRTGRRMNRPAEIWPWDTAIDSGISARR